MIPALDLFYFFQSFFIALLISSNLFNQANSHFLGNLESYSFIRLLSKFEFVNAGVNLDMYIPQQLNAV